MIYFKPIIQKVMHTSSTKSRIIASAEKLFAQYGTSAVTMSQIARESGISCSAIYYYYPSKEDLFEHILKNIETIFRDNFFIVDEKKDSTEQISEFCQFFFDAYDQNTNLIIIFLNGRLKSDAKRIKKMILNIENRISEVLEEILDNGRDQSYLKSDLSNLVYIKMILGILVETAVFKKRSEPFLKNEHQTTHFQLFQNEAILLIKDFFQKHS